ncbi:quinone-dependent dihydroorotate dehydrogenase [Flaviflexus equikiangi]|uniref:Dihydroorotate dehydrogenase (quinone) n=1 Tax=Flaviflexus equikiangi TaxID=2758573 RepID=A0ABS2TF17_9ACTO|nr:quinone-dependent dihydroorotate dehydrogenase [Flaviflexus equikiangi]MBM9433246.1 quinone-dependent dihydroorotate dehydrogenase [Flaviflexus equikiangi]
MLYRLLFDTLITKSDPEQAHGAAVKAIAMAGRSPLAPLMRASIGWRKSARQTTALPRPIPGLVGLAAGMDKNAEAIEGMDALGFAFVEIGTVTPEPQPGNEQPRMWRHLEDRALRNAMGFNNDGSAAVAERLAELRSTARGRAIIVGVNIGKNKWTSEEDAARDYETCATRLAAYADYLVVNVSSPNTPGLRDLQRVEALRPIIRATRRAATASAGRPVPLLLKIAPDMDLETVREIAALVVEEGLDGVVATNTTVDHSYGRGGVSGRPLTERSLEIVRTLRDCLPLETIIIGVGGISTVDDASAMLGAGADLLQIYSSFVYEGPLLPGKLNRAFSHL